MKKLIGVGALLLLVACQRKVQVSSPTPSGGSSTTASGAGAGTPSEALAAFMAAAKAEDLQAVGSIWGDPDGLAREKMTRQEFEMRAYIVVKCVRHDRYSLLSEGSAADNRRVAAVQITKGALSKTTNFTFARNKQSRWYVEKFEMEPVTQICQAA